MFGINSGCGVGSSLQVKTAAVDNASSLCCRFLGTSCALPLPRSSTLMKELHQSNNRFLHPHSTLQPYAYCVRSTLPRIPYQGMLKSY